MLFLFLIYLLRTWGRGKYTYIWMRHSFIKRCNVLSLLVPWSQLWWWHPRHCGHVTPSDDIIMTDAPSWIMSLSLSIGGLMTPVSQLSLLSLGGVCGCRAGAGSSWQSPPPSRLRRLWPFPAGPCSAPAIDVIVPRSLSPSSRLPDSMPPHRSWDSARVWHRSEVNNQHLGEVMLQVQFTNQMMIHHINWNIIYSESMSLKCLNRAYFPGASKKKIWWMMIRHHKWRMIFPVS